MPAALAIVLGGVDVTVKVDMTSVTMQLAGSQEIATCEFDLVDVGNTVAADAEDTLTVTEVGTAEVLFGGFLRSRRVTVITNGRILHVQAVDYNSLLDRSIVVSDSRTAGESDTDRLEYLMTTYGSQFSSDYSQIATLNASMPAQKFIAITLRQAIERVLGQASTKSSYYCDPTGRLVTYDRSVPTAAPFDVRVGTPGVGEIAVDDFSIDFDSSNLANAINVVGATAAGSGWFTDTTSITAYGRRERFFNAPDSDTSAKAMQVGLAVLEDQKNPVPRGSFTTQSPNDGWRIGQSITVNSTQHDLTDHVYRIARVTVRYLSGAGDRHYTIEVGAPLPTLSALLGATHGGGGGFPWHSPGGAGGWPGVGGSGTPGGSVVPTSGCGQCAPKPYCVTSSQRETFTRTEASDLGNSEFDGGPAWSKSGTGTSHSVNGTQAVLVSDPVVAARDAVSLAFAGSVIEILWQFTAEDTGGNGTTQGALGLWDGANRVATIDYTATALGTTVTFGLYLAGVLDAAFSVPDATIVVGDEFWARMLINGAVLSGSIGEAPPSGSAWDGTDTAAASPATPNILDVVVAAGGDTLRVNTIGVIQGLPGACLVPSVDPPVPGQPVEDAPFFGDGTTTSFSTDWDFAPGSLRVLVDNGDQTSAIVYAEGNDFHLSFAPESDELVRIRYQAA